MRALAPDELLILRAMLSVGETNNRYLSFLDSARVADMQDGGMGSIRFDAPTVGMRQFGRELCEQWFKDVDGVHVSISINVDQDDHLYEMDVWKVNNDPVFRPFSLRPAVVDDHLDG